MIASTTRPTTVNVPATAPVLLKKLEDLDLSCAEPVGDGVVEGVCPTTVVTVIV